MLETNDMNLLQNMMASFLDKVDERFEKSETFILAKMDKRFEESEATMSEKLAKMNERLDKSEASMLAKMDKRFEESEASMLAKMDEKLVKSEGLILDELERTRGILEKRIEKVQNNLDELNQYYRITKLEKDNTSILLKLIDDLSKRVEELEKRTA